MAKICTQTNVVEVDESAAKCNGMTSSDCIIHEQAIAYLGLPINTTLTEVLEALLLSLTDARNRIGTLENQ